MSLYVCPRCESQSFRQEEREDLIAWQCGSCKYAAYSESTREEECGNCGEHALIELHTQHEDYTYCKECGHREE